MKSSKKSNKKYLIILLIVFLLALAVGYAAFSDTLTISGTANANGTFDLEFQNSVVDQVVGCDEEKTKAIISENKNQLDVTVKDLGYPGAGAQFTVDIVNVGTVAAIVESVEQTNITGSTNIKIKGLDAISEAHPKIEPGKKCTLTYTVEWDATSNTELTEEEKAGINFGLVINYKQAEQTMFNGTNTHTDEV